MYFLRNIACAALLFHRQEKNTHIQTCTHVYQLVYLFVFYKPDVLEVTWAAFRPTTVLCLDILWKCYFLIL